MSITQLNPYLIFNGEASSAIEFYKSALGAKVEVLTHYGDMSQDQANSPNKDRVIHCMLQLGGGIVMISDEMPDSPTKLQGNVHVCLNFDDRHDMQRKFDALATGGNVVTALHDTFWNATYGALVDKFHIQWMFNCNKR